MIKWIAAELGKDTVFHISRYFPGYKITTEATSAYSMHRLERIAVKELNYVYIGNRRAESNNTYFRNCDAVLISRQSYSINTDGLDEDGKCKICGKYFLKKT